ncbi:hypothetical protein T484DRAFT_2259466 [Baffinella frigidus]|nr:hypothetical protein T484DRAFT_2259466 [Cryptophyta sp. CCMP2293]
MVLDFATAAFLNCLPAMEGNAVANIKAAADTCTVETYRLWFHFRIREGDGSVTYVVEAILYLGITSVGLAILYTYFLNVHSKGRILDLFRRVTCKEGLMFVPLDVEVSPAELEQALKNARRWRGRDGELRQVVVTDLAVDYTGLDDEEVGGTQTLTHLAVYTQKEGVRRTLFRHFLRLPDGAIVEVIGDELQYVVSPAVLVAVTELVHDTVGAGTPRIEPTSSAASKAPAANGRLGRLPPSPPQTARKTLGAPPSWQSGARRVSQVSLQTRNPTCGLC